jgi:hypothetical protein
MIFVKDTKECYDILPREVERKCTKEIVLEEVEKLLTKYMDNTLVDIPNVLPQLRGTTHQIYYVLGASFPNIIVHISFYLL